ncbi:hypothetical protein ACOSP7_006208 [Xanthoceras sorbifolium]
MPENSISKEAAYQIINDQLILDGNPRLNLASFVTTWMEPECNKLMIEAEAKPREKKRQEEISVGTTSDVQTEKTIEDIQPMVDNGLLVDCLAQQDLGSVIVSFQESEPTTDVPSKDTDEVQSDF